MAFIEWTSWKAIFTRPRLTFGLVKNIVFGKVPTGIAGKRVCQSIPKEKSAKEKQYGIFLANSF